ncbi:dTDP-4-dehydrorhamnose reductase [Calderihabitans maritimus]|uniref:dTDP-4-dehydrorhamnose reductase n=1 Tax=Calderihabitans maritimus TaxID=1246530 RepID=A0A1Z5HXG3_9FIRM|nr:dTDP-4-dehydrorhamnose reductase [Calderihabitans maritimus]GAW94057.1 dTDP 4-dehydrorhamnose reductase [Calderihabitans maritimus]
MKIAVIGAGGQLGSDIVKVLQGTGHRCYPLAHRDIEVADRESCAILRELKPEVVINTAAFHQVDACEDDPEKAFRVNAVGAKNVAEICAGIDATCVYISTDYVFDGTKKEGYVEEDPPNPLNTYGISKLAGELYTRRCPRHYIFRVASLFGVAGASGKGGNFVETMIAKARRGEKIRVVDDMFMSPTYTWNAAEVLLKAVEQGIDHGIYHLTNGGSCSWFQFAREIFTLLGLEVDLQPVSSAQFKQKAIRPRYSNLNNQKLKHLGLKPWKKALATYLREKGYLS